MTGKYFSLPTVDHKLKKREQTDESPLICTENV